MLKPEAHAERPWRIHAATADFRVEDVWLLPGRGGPGDFPRLVETICTMDPGEGSAVSRALWSLRWKLGALLGWDDEDTGIGARVASLRERLPADLRQTGTPRFAELPFQPLYLTEDEFAAEIANGTMHGVMHLGAVPDGDDGGFRVQLAVLVKPNGLLGQAYMLAIRPFRHLIVYPAMMRRGGELWERARGTAPTPA
jgi:hypothetical protein